MGKSVTESAAHQAVMRDEAIEKYGLMFWGLSMRHYEDWA